MGPPPTQVEYSHMRFIITSIPEAYSLHPYIQVSRRTPSPLMLVLKINHHNHLAVTVTSDLINEYH